MRAPLLIATLVFPALASAARYTVPVDVGAGPAAYVFTGSLFADQPVHFGLKLNVEAVIDQAWIRKNPRAVPRQYQKMARSIEEVRFSPSPFIPDALILSPKLRQTGMFGATWRPWALSAGFGKGAARLSLGAGVLLTGAYIFSDTLPNTVFVRPGLDLKAEVELAASKSFLLSFGWASAFYVPQGLGTFGIAPALEDNIWHVGQAFLMLHVRFPYTVNQ